MLLDELLIKIGIEADSAAMQRLEQIVQALGEQAESGAEQLGEFAQAVEQMAADVAEDVKKMPEFAHFFKSLDELEQATESLSQDEALNAWAEKLAQADELLSHLGEDFLNDGDALRSQLEQMGASAEQIEQIFTALNERQQETKESTEENTKAQQEFAETLEQSSESIDEFNEQLKQQESQFEQNTEKAQTLFDELGMGFAEQYGITAFADKLKRFGVTISETALKVGGFAAAIATSLTQVTQFVDAQFNALDEIHQLANVTGETADQIYNLGKVAEVNGSSMQAAQASIEGLSRTIGEAATGVGRGAKAFEQYGLSAKNAKGSIKTAGEMMGEISDKMQAMSRQEQIAMLSKLGIDGSMIQTLRLGNAELAEAIENAQKLTLGVGTAENAEQAAAFKDAMTELSQIFTSMGEYLALRIAPSIQRLIEKFKAWFLANDDVVKAVLNGFGKVFSFAFEVIGAIGNIIDSTIGWKNALYIVGAAFLWLSRQMLLAFARNPMAWAIAGIMAVILLVDDFITYLKGGETALGDFWEPFAQALDWIMELIAEFQPEIQAVVAFILAQWARVKTMFSGLMTYLKGVMAFWKALFTGDTKGMISALKTMWSGLKTFFSALFSAIWAIVKVAFKAIGALFGAVFDLISIPFKKAWDWVSAKWAEFTDSFSVDPIGTIFDLVIDLITAPFRLAFEAVTGLWALFTGESFTLNDLTKVFNDAKDIIIKAFKAAFDWVTETWNNITSWFSDFFGSEKKMNITANVNTVSSGIAQSAALASSALLLNPSATAKAGAVDNSQSDHSVKNSNNKTIVNVALNGTGNTAQEAKMIGNAAAKAVANQQSSVVG